MKNSTPVNIPTTTAYTAKNLSGKAPLFRATAKRFARVAFAVLSLGLLATACKNDTTPPAPNSNQTFVAFTATAIDFQQPGGTKATAPLTSDGERKVADLWVVQFDKGTGVRVGSPVYVTIDPEYQVGANVAFSADLTSKTTAQVLYFLANTHDKTLLNTTNTANITTLNNITQSILPELQPTNDGGLPMFGTKEVVNIESGTPVHGIQLERLVSRITIRYKNNYSGFTIHGVQLRNIPTAIAYTTAPTGSVNYPTKTPAATGADSHFNYSIEDPATATDGGSGYSSFTWYMPENLRKPAAANPANLPLQDRILANTDDQMATWVEITGITSTNILVSYAILLGKVDVSTNDFDVSRNTGYTISFEIAGKNSSDPRIVSTPITTILPAQTANTYMITPGTGISFPTKIKGNEATNTLATQSVGLLWQDVSGLVKSTTYDSGTGRTLILINGTKGSGNFLAAAYDGPNGTGNILWSWHIWVTDYKPSEAGVAVRTANTSYAVTGGQVHTYGTQFQTANGTSRTIMDRNLGATIGYNTTVPTTATEATGTYGMAYEWGRKDPFPPAITTGTTTGPSIPLYNASGVVIPAASAPTIVDVGGTPGGTTVANSILNPTTFYYNTITTSTFDWADPQDATLWLPTSKTLYDPCPKGWRVPPQNTWMDFTRTSATVGTFLWYNSGVLNTSTETLGSQNGRRYTAGTVNAWYPASGFRDWNGMVAAGQTNGQWASSTTTTGTSHYLYFAPSFLWTDSFCTRSSGLSVRCVQE